MAEESDQVGSELEHEPTAFTRRARRDGAARSTTHPTPRVPKAAAKPPALPVTTRPSARHAHRPVRSVVILSMVAGLIATVALPAYASWQPEVATPTLQQVSAGDTQDFVVASDASAEQLSRDSYSATTADEIEKKKAAEAAAERARQLASASASASTTSSSRVSSIDLTMTSPGSGEVRSPLPVGSYRVGDGVGARGGAHMGTDMLAPAMTPIFASIAGVVRIAQDNYGAYGTAVVVDGVLNGQKVTITYPHMTTGSFVVQVGQTVTAGQVLGGVGSTGRSTANHLHFEVWIDGSVVDSYAWLQANAS